MPEQKRSRSRPHVHTRMHEKHSKRISPGIAVSVQFQKCSKRFLCMFVSGLRVPLEYFLGLSLYVMGEFSNELFKAFYHTPVPNVGNCQATVARSWCENQ
jgi:hypothetical protein